ncbi:MAG: alkaline phosphatase D family protein [Bryobacterales bacterium]
MPQRDRPASRVGVGVKVGEVTDSSAVIWTRVPKPEERPMEGKKDLKRWLRRLFFEEDMQVRLRYGVSEDFSNVPWMPWEDAEIDHDDTRQFVLSGLRADTKYYFEIEGADESRRTVYEVRRGSFRTAPAADRAVPIRFTVGTCQRYDHVDSLDGFVIYESMRKLDPAFFVMTGDSVYYDRGPMIVKNAEMARLCWRQMYTLPRLFDFHAEVPTYWEKDDHDMVGDDCWPGKPRTPLGEIDYETGRQIYYEQTPRPRDKPYRTFRWGKLVQIWLLEVRDYRSPNSAPDGPEKTIWGREQKDWFVQGVAQSDAVWKIFINPTPLVGPDRALDKRDNHANKAFRTEGSWARRWAASQGDRFVVVVGDRHWQYHSVDPKTGLNEYACGPASDMHAGGSPGFERKYHRFHRVAGGFLSVQAEEKELRIRHHAVDGTVVYEDVRHLPA